MTLRVLRDKPLGEANSLPKVVFAYGSNALDYIVNPFGEEKNPEQQKESGSETDSSCITTNQEQKCDRDTVEKEDKKLDKQFEKWNHPNSS